AAVARSGVHSVELFSASGHFNFRSPEHVREFANWLESTGVQLHSVHAPTDRSNGRGREGGAPISIAEPDKLRRIEAVDEMKWAMELAEEIPFRYFVVHMGTGREPLDQRHQDAAFNSLEYLVVFAKARGLTIAIENTPGELATPEALADFLRQTRLNELKLCFDVGHARLGEGIEASLDFMRERVVTTHIHDNRGEFDDHLLPFEGTIDWPAAMRVLRSAPADLPLVFELKEPANGGWQSVLERAGAAFERLEKLAAEQGSAAD
ncbi:MAG: sugar phosphate isomerase/epimerase, partial [Acidobacteriota bacterium]|nr:sugar phosphate isomerase/epimerase [Acidobacteriota bacterium]